MGKSLSVLGLLAVLTLCATATFARDFPRDARRGTITAHAYPNYRIGTVTYRLAVGGRIFNQQNLIIMPASLPRRAAEVMFRLDSSGELSAIWLLTPEEAARYPKPITAPPPKSGR